MKAKKEKQGTETKKAFLLLLIAGLFILLFPISMLSSNNFSKKEVNTFFSYLEDGKTHVVYLKKENCGYCELYTPVLEKLAADYGVTYETIDITKLTTTDLKSILNKAGIEYKTFGTPTTLILKEGTVSASYIGVMDRESLFQFLKENGILEENAILTNEYEYLTETNYQEYEDLIQSNDKSVIVIGQTTCIHCIEAKPVLDEISKEYNVTINYLNYTKLSKEEREALYHSISYFEENEKWGTPLFLVVQQGNNLNSLSGFKDKETVVSFLKENELIK